MDPENVIIYGGLIENLVPHLQYILTNQSFDKNPTQNNQNKPTNEKRQ
mgnify:CR=1 FL=1